ncbi:MAG: UbiH/UbiF/VisC/COQ6 family ubiquinone biosynthesis hydroxylase [Pseudomonadales bacterium]
MSATRHFDIVIAGGGMVGLALACALRDTSYEIALIEARDYPQSVSPTGAAPENFDPRVSALTVASQNFFSEIGVWSAIVEQRVCAFDSMQVWDAAGSAEIDFKACDLRQPLLGHIVENRVTLQALLAVAKASQNINLYVPQSVQEAQFDTAENQSVELQLQNGEQLTTQLLVAADGGQSSVRELAGFATRQWSYGQRAIVTTVRTEHAHRQTARQRFLPTGPLAFLPLADGEQRCCSIVWSAADEYADSLLALDNEAFANTLAEAFEHRLGAVQELARRYSFPLQQRHSTSYVKPGVALLGDAAHVIHPLAGQGANLGIQDVQVLVEELQRASTRSLQPGSMHVLERYQRRRMGSNLLMMGAVEGFKRIFSESSLPVRWLRNTGMRQLNSLGPIKQHIMRQAMGL